MPSNAVERVRPQTRVDDAEPLCSGPPAYQLADWRRRVNAMYDAVRRSDEPRAAWQAWCETRRDLFQRHPVSPIPSLRRAHYKGPITFAYDPELRFQVDLLPADGPAEAVDLGPDGRLSRRPVGVTVGLASKLSSELTVYWIDGYGGGLFLPFKDATNGTQTYGGGRYLIDAIKGADLGLSRAGRLILDFNFAYHPSCAHNPDFVCPLAPPENTLSEPVQAGERL